MAWEPVSLEMMCSRSNGSVIYGEICFWFSNGSSQDALEIFKCIDSFRKNGSSSLTSDLGDTRSPVGLKTSEPKRNRNTTPNTSGLCLSPDDPREATSQNNLNSTLSALIATGLSNEISETCTPFRIKRASFADSILHPTQCETCDPSEDPETHLSPNQKQKGSPGSYLLTSETSGSIKISGTFVKYASEKDSAEKKHSEYFLRPKKPCKKPLMGRSSSITGWSIIHGDSMNQQNPEANAATSRNNSILLKLQNRQKEKAPNEKRTQSIGSKSNKENIEARNQNGGPMTRRQAVVYKETNGIYQKLRGCVLDQKKKSNQKERKKSSESYMTIIEVPRKETKPTLSNASGIFKTKESLMDSLAPSYQIPKKKGESKSKESFSGVISQRKPNETSSRVFQSTTSTVKYHSEKGLMEKREGIPIEGFWSLKNPEKPEEVSFGLMREEKSQKKQKGSLLKELEAKTRRKEESKERQGVSFRKIEARKNSDQNDLGICNKVAKPRSDAWRNYVSHPVSSRRTSSSFLVMNQSSIAQKTMI